MKDLVMEVQNFFNGMNNVTLLGGQVLAQVKVGDEVEIVTTRSGRKTRIVGIKRFNQSLDCVNGGVAGLLFEGIGDLDFRTTPLPPNPYNPKTQLEEYLKFSSKDNDAENVRIVRAPQPVAWQF
jgi:translation elongation factor EF-Tu-like GTPase